MNPMLALRQYQKVNGVAQTSEASPHRLVQMLMQGGLDRMAQAKGAIARNDIAQRGILLGKAIDIIGGLREGLDLENHADNLAELDSLYVYMSRRLTEANLKGDPAIIDEVARLLITVKEGWDAIGDQSSAS
ncbi:flagellar export chaperone FliS [Pseudomonas monteilii]|jgi:flagellar protein FliS|uniref:Flagellar secretion chaperone FliS n=2 Tax=Pseudomonas putida group TaxID=136845 RepID=A0A3G2HJL5_9PSED|nr:MULTISPECIES: flagellar export chaperone FliS [Pseudomonas]MDR2315687.1 flagellar export chaperone FliS [Pseudomonas sp.]AYN17247.1 flagellar protein FliS [Pseudomonas monteilii]AYN99133.1 flagella export chaperone FliS [Pseudomonas sp. LTGT-11-2Z]MBA6090750.1 flagellar export chaperone FliS [Pseudomonas monteilii]MBA6103093.1 flagellar export chaperone FliS [Pseudomonas monteilii]